MENKEDFALVKDYHNGIATIKLKKSGSCEGCAMHGICGVGDRSVSHQVKTDIPLKSGDLVRVYISPATRIVSSFIVYIFPILVMILFYLLAKLLFKFSEDLSILSSLAGLLLSGVVIHILDKKFSQKINFEIIEKIEKK